MALDSALKRASAINPGAPWRSLLPPPSGTISGAVRQMLGLVYAGIAAVMGTVFPISASVTVDAGTASVAVEAGEASVNLRAAG